MKIAIQYRTGRPVPMKRKRIFGNWSLPLQNRDSINEALNKADG